MNNTIRSFTAKAKLDETGEFEEFTWNLSPTISDSETLHLKNDGLPKLGVRLSPGMILIGKIGKTKAYLTSAKPTALELNALDFQELRERFGHLWKNTSVYVPKDCWGVVESADCTEDDSGRKIAVVRVRLDTR